MTYIQPLILSVLLISFLGLVRARKRKSISLAVAGAAALFLISWPPIDWLFSLPLEARYSRGPISIGAAPDAIVVFSTSVSPPSTARPFSLPDHDLVERCEFAAWLHRRWPEKPVLASGGRSKDGLPPLSVMMRDWLRRAGVAESRIWTEELSTSTYENAFYTAEILRKAGIKSVALVVDGSSMPRAAACLRKQGIQVVPAPSSLRHFGTSLSEELIPSWQSIGRNERTLHEILGLVWYWLRGRV